MRDASRHARRLSGSGSAASDQSAGSMHSDSAVLRGARFSRVYVDPAQLAAASTSASAGASTTASSSLSTKPDGAGNAAAKANNNNAGLLMRSPVNTAAGAMGGIAMGGGGVAPKHSTPQPARRTLFSRIFRMKSSRARGFDDDEAAASPSSHRSTPTAHSSSGSGHDHGHGHGSTRHRLLYRRTEDRAAAAAELGAPDFSRTVSAPVAAVGAGVAMPASAQPLHPHQQHQPQQHRILMEGPLVKLSSHKYWHAKATHFVLDEHTGTDVTRSRITLRQFARAEDARGRRERDRVSFALQEIELSEWDVIVDISDRYIKHGIELLHHGPPVVKGERKGEAISASATNNDASEYGDNGNDSDGGEASPLHSLRLSASDGATHHLWMRVLGSAIARLIDQSKRHYPNAPADLDFARGRKNVEPEAVSAIVSTAVPVRASISAKVMPMIGDSAHDEYEDELDGERENQDLDRDEKQRNDFAVMDREVAIRNPEELPLDEGNHNDRAPLQRQQSDAEPESPRTSLSAISDCFSDEWPSNHSNGSNNNSNNNNNASHADDGGYISEDNNHTSNQQDDGDDLHTFIRRPSECSPSTHSTSYSPHELDPTSAFRSSPNVATSVVSTPSPYGAGSVNPFTRDHVAEVTAAMAASSIGPMSAHMEVSTPPSNPPDRPKYPHSGNGFVPFMPRTGMRPQVHSFNANGQVFTLDVRYRLLKSIGNGAYGAVIAAKDSVLDTSIAVKKITNIFDDLVDAKRILREVRLLRHFHHKNITQLLDLAPPLSKKHFEDMYIITELMETDLHQVIYSMQPMSDDHVKYFLYQMLCALYHIHSAGVLHRDMKPSNILLNSNCDLKVCDFGLARGGMDSDKDARSVIHPSELTEYVVTRWYRAPEIMLNCLQYTAAIDVWAVGCIFAEMLLREPLFPGNDYIHQLKLIIKFLGTPKQDDIGFVKNVKALRFLTKLAISKPKKWREVFTGEDVNPLALDLLSQMLIFNPDKRITVEKALQHPYLATFYDPADISRAPEFDFAFDLPDDKLTKDALVDLLCEDIACFHPMVQYTVPPPPPPPTSSSRYFGMTASAS